MSFPHSFQGCFPLLIKSSGIPRPKRLLGLRMNSDLCLSHSGQITSLLWVSSVYLWNGTHNSCLAQGEKDQCVWSCLLNCTVWCILEGHLGLLWYHTVLLLCSHSSLCALLESFCTQSPIILSAPGGDKVTWLNDKWASLGLHPLLYLFLPLNSSYILFIISLYIIHKSQHSDMNTVKGGGWQVKRADKIL